MASAGARAYSGGLGAEPPAGSRGRTLGQAVRGRSPPKAESCTSRGNGKFASFFPTDLLIVRTSLGL